MTQQKELLTIGGFASMTRLSLKALRLYDQLGILQPHHIDPQTGYRYYGADQLASARMIRIMREMDMPLATIQQVLALVDVTTSTAAELEWHINEYVEMRERALEQVRKQVPQLIQLIHQEVRPMSLEVKVKNIAPQQVLSITNYVKVDKLDSAIKQSLDAFSSLLAAQNAQAVAEPFGIFRGKISEQETGPIEVCIPVDAALKPVGNIEIKTLPGGQAASVTMIGAQCDFPAVLGGYDLAAEWIQANGYEMADSPREVWYNPPTEKAKMEGADVKMEVIWLFKEADAKL